MGRNAFQSTMSAMRHVTLFFLVGTVLAGASGDGVSCPVQTSDCYCRFANEGDPTDGVEKAREAESKASTMAIAAGALGPLVVVGMGFGIWKLVRNSKDWENTDFMSSEPSESPEYTSRRGSNGSVSLLGTDDEITFSNSRAGSTTDLMDEDGTKQHPSHNWGSHNVYPGADIPGSPKHATNNLAF